MAQQHYRKGNPRPRLGSTSREFFRIEAFKYMLSIFECYKLLAGGSLCDQPTALKGHGCCQEVGTKSLRFGTRV